VCRDLPVVTDMAAPTHGVYLIEDANEADRDDTNQSKKVSEVLIAARRT